MFRKLFKTFVAVYAIVIILVLGNLFPIFAQTDIPHFEYPFGGYRITTYFSSYHPGVDLAAPLGTNIHPIAEGVVMTTGYDRSGLGNIVVVEHKNGYQSLYAHMGKISVSKYQIVKTSDILGQIGLTGRTTGPHTHMEVKKDGKYINPLSVVTLPYNPDTEISQAPASEPNQIYRQAQEPTQYTTYNAMPVRTQLQTFKQPKDNPIFWTFVLFSPMIAAVAYKSSKKAYSFVRGDSLDSDPTLYWYVRHSNLQYN